MKVIIDIETRHNEEFKDSFCESIKPPANYKDLAKIEQYIEEKKLESLKHMALSADYGSIICVGVLECDNPVARCMTMDEFSSYIENGHCMHLITFNGKSFDIPYIIKEGIRLGMNLPYKWLSECTSRYRSHDHTDLADVLCFNDRSKLLSLDTYSKIYLGKSKSEIDFSTATDDEIKEHCKEDLLLTYELYEKFKEVC